MILRIGTHTFDDDRVPFVLYWKDQKARKRFVEEVMSVKTLRRFIPIKGITFVRVEPGVFGPNDKLAVKFTDTDERRAVLTELHDLGDEVNMYVACPDDIPYTVVSDWIEKALPDMGIKPDATIQNQTDTTS